MEGWTIAQAMSVAAVLLTGGTVLFSALAIYAERDFFLMLGLVACVAGNAAFAFYLWEQGVEGEFTDALVANFGCMVLLSLFAIGVQFEGYRELGMGEEEDKEGGAMEEATPRAPAARLIKGAPADPPASQVRRRK